MASDPKSNKRTGKVKWFNVTKGFGFITPDDGGEELFVHQSAIHAQGFRSLREGETVEFGVDKGEDDRIRASDVTGPGGAHVLGASYGSGPRSSPTGTRGGGGGRGNTRGGFGGSGFSSRAPRGRFGSQASRASPGPGGDSIVCYNCNEPGHISRDCNTQPRRRGPRSLACYNCGEEGHISRDCPAPLAN